MPQIAEKIKGRSYFLNDYGIILKPTPPDTEQANTIAIRELIAHRMRAPASDKSRMIKRITSFLLIAVTCRAFSEEPQDNFPTVRARGMGNAFTAISDDESAAWTNPAGLSRNRKARAQTLLHAVEFPNLIVGVNGAGSSLTNSPDLFYGTQGAAKSALSAIGNSAQNFWLQSASNPLMVFSFTKYAAPLALGVYTNSRLSVIPDRTSSSSVADGATAVQWISDYGAQLGSSFSTASNRLNIGFMLRPMQRSSFNHKILASDLSDSASLKSTLKSGTNTMQGLGVDLGMMWTLADFWFPTVAVSALNLPTGCANSYLNPFSATRQTVCGTVLSGSLRNPDDSFRVIPSDLRIGVSIIPRITTKFALRFAVDMQHMYIGAGSTYDGLSGLSAVRQLHAGVEAFLGNPLQVSPLSIRAGISDGFFSSGLSLNFWRVSLEFASYGQDISASQIPAQDQRTVIKASMHF